MKNGASAQVVLVTGCSSGIGHSICDLLAANGARVYGGSRTSCEPRDWTYLRLDVTDEASVQQAVAESGPAGIAIAGPLAGKTAIDGKPTAYACLGPQCSLPVTEPDALLEVLRGQRSPAAV